MTSSSPLTNQVDSATTATTKESEFANNFRRVRACARCHRLKMRCVFEDPTFQSCKRCFAANLDCSMTEDPTFTTARTRARKRAKIQGSGPIANLSHSISTVHTLLQKAQREMTTRSNSSLSLPEEDATSSDEGQKKGKTPEDKNFEVDKLNELQTQLSELQRLLSHVISTKSDHDEVNSNTSNTENSSKIKSDFRFSGTASSINSMKDGPVKSVPKLPWISFDHNIVKELFRLKILEVEDAKKKLDFFINDMLCYWPCVSLPTNYTFDYLLENEPLVLLGFIAVTCLNTPDLHDTLLYYLEANLVQRVAITGEITVSQIQIYLVLSLWCSPPKKWGSYKHQMSLLTALDLCLCLDLGNEQHRQNPNVLKADSEERKILRAFMGVYSCCGSLGLSLPRFKVVSWTINHENSRKLLLMGESNRNDRFISFYSKLISIGEEVFQFLCPEGTPSNAIPAVTSSFTKVKKEEDSDPTKTKEFQSMEEESTNHNQFASLSHESLRSIMISYEKRMQQVATESQLLTSTSKERNLLSIIYYQLLMTMYDYVVCRVLLKREVLTEVYLQTLSRLIRASEKVIDSFVSLCDQTHVFPTFFYYRPMHALVALVRARLLVRTQRLELEVDVEREFDRVSSALEKVSETSLVARKMKVILTRVDKWMKVSKKFTKNGANSSMVTLLDELGKEKAIEVIKITKNAVPANLDNNKPIGDNININPESKAHFSKFIHYNAESLSNSRVSGGFPRPVVQQQTPQQQPQAHLQKPTQSKPQQQQYLATSPSSDRSYSNDPTAKVMANSESVSVFVPSPIGFSKTDNVNSPSSLRKQSQQPNPELMISPPDNLAASQFFGSAFEGIPTTTPGPRESISKITIDTPSNLNSTQDNLFGSEEINNKMLNDLFMQIDNDIANFLPGGGPSFQPSTNPLSAGNNNTAQFQQMGLNAFDEGMNMNTNSQPESQSVNGGSLGNLFGDVEGYGFW